MENPSQTPRTLRTLVAIALAATALAPAARGEDEHWQWTSQYPVWIHVDGSQGDDDAWSYGLYPELPVRTLGRAIELLEDPEFPYNDWPWVRIVVQGGTFRQATDPYSPLPWEEQFPIELPQHLKQVSIEVAVHQAATIECVPVLSLEPLFLRHAGTDVRFKNLRFESYNPDTPFLTRPVLLTVGAGASGTPPLEDDQLTVFDNCYLETAGALVSGTAWEPGRHAIKIVDTTIDFRTSLFTNMFAVDLLVDDYASVAPTLEVEFQRSRVLAGGPVRIRRWSWVEGADVSLRAYNSDFRGYTHFGMLVSDSFSGLSGTHLELWHCSFRSGWEHPQAGPPKGVVAAGPLVGGTTSSIVNTVFRGHQMDIEWDSGAGYPAALDVRGIASDAPDFAGTPGFVPVDTTDLLFVADALGDDEFEAHVLPDSPLVDAGVWPIQGNTGEVDRGLHDEPRHVSASPNVTPDIGPDEAWDRRVWIDRHPAAGEEFLLRACGPPNEVAFLGIDLTPMPDEVPPLSFDPMGETLFLPSTWWTELWIEVLPPAQPLVGTNAAITEALLQIPPPHPNPVMWPNAGQWLHFQAGFVDPVTGFVRYSVNDAYLFVSE